MTQEQLSELLDGVDMTKVADIVGEPQHKGQKPMPKQVPAKGEKTLTRIEFPHTAPSATENIDVKKMPTETDNTKEDNSLMKKAIFEKLEEASGIDIEKLVDGSVLTKVAEQHVLDGEEMLYKEASLVAEQMADIFLKRIDEHGRR